MGSVFTQHFNMHFSAAVWHALRQFCCGAFLMLFYSFYLLAISLYQRFYALFSVTEPLTAICSDFSWAVNAAPKSTCSVKQSQWTTRDLAGAGRIGHKSLSWMCFVISWINLKIEVWPNMFWPHISFMPHWSTFAICCNLCWGRSLCQQPGSYACAWNLEPAISAYFNKCSCECLEEQSEMQRLPDWTTWRGACVSVFIFFPILCLLEWMKTGAHHVLPNMN